MSEGEIQLKIQFLGHPATLQIRRPARGLHLPAGIRQLNKKVWGMQDLWGWEEGEGASRERSLSQHMPLLLCLVKLLLAETSP